MNEDLGITANDPALSNPLGSERLQDFLDFLGPKQIYFGVHKRLHDDAVGCPTTQETRAKGKREQLDEIDIIVL